MDNLKVLEALFVLGVLVIVLAVIILGVVIWCCVMTAERTSTPSLVTIQVRSATIAT